MKILDADRVILTEGLLRTAAPSILGLVLRLTLGKPV